jgi:hypothetical protein
MATWVRSTPRRLLLDQGRLDQFFTKEAAAWLAKAE